MKTQIYHVGLMLAVSTQISSCQQVSEREYSLKVRAVDVDGNAVGGIHVITSGIEPVVSPQITLGKPVTTDPVLTDDQGNAVIRFKSLPEPSGNVSFNHDDWYPTSARAIWEDRNENGELMRGAEIKAVLKPIKNPIPMHAYDNTGAMAKIVNIPEFDREYGFDLMIAEALPPLGKGKIADFKFTIRGHHHGIHNYGMTINIVFANPEDGVVEFLTPQRSALREPAMIGSAFISSYDAPEAGYIRDIKRGLKRIELEKHHESDVDFRRNFYFRTRTKIDPEGRIISAHYGKIYGDFQFEAANKDWGYVATLALLTTYFNPTPNDRNVEFDPKNNLHSEGNALRP